MKTDRITIQVDAEVAQAYRSASEEERREIDSLLNLKLRSATRSQVSLQAYMDVVSTSISRHAFDKALDHYTDSRGREEVHYLHKKCPDS